MGAVVFVSILKPERNAFLDAIQGEFYEGSHPLELYRALREEIDAIP